MVFFVFYLFLTALNKRETQSQVETWSDFTPSFMSTRLVIRKKSNHIIRLLGISGIVHTVVTYLPQQWRCGARTASLKDPWPHMPISPYHLIITISQFPQRTMAPYPHITMSSYANVLIYSILVTNIV